MHKKIQNLAYAGFRYDRPKVVFTDDAEELKIELFCREVFHGKFSFREKDGGLLRGMIISSHPRMKCLTPFFEGTKVEAEFEFHSEGLKVGQTQKGEFTILYDGGEAVLPFTVCVIPFYLVSSKGKVENLDDFSRLAQESYEEAYRIYQTSSFERLLKSGNKKELLLYQALGGKRASMQDMEEFLLGTGEKQEVQLILEQEKTEYHNVTEDVREKLPARKENWGYAEWTVTSDSAAVQPVKSRISTADFVGNRKEIEFVIHSEVLHAGKNYARITIEGRRQSIRYEICIVNPLKIRKKSAREKKQLLAKITRLYLDFRMQRITTGVWSKETCICLERLQDLEPDCLWYELYHAQTLLINRQRQEAEWILDRIRLRMIRKESSLYAYYVYLTTLDEGDPAYTAKAFRQIQKIFYKNQDNIRLFLIMLFMDPELNQSKSRKLSAIEEKVLKGNHSPILYAEACNLILHDVYLLNRPGTFERQVLYWAAKEEVLSPTVAGKICQIAPKIRDGQKIWYEILKTCYLTAPGRETLQALCSFCIKWNLYSSEQFAWFDRGIREDLRIAGLYEAWMDCVREEQLEQFPRNVMLYFQYQSSLNDKKRAMLYACIVDNREKQESMYEAYREKIEHFAAEQLMAGCIDDHLAVLYRMLPKDLILNEAYAQGTERLKHTWKVMYEDGRAVRVAAKSMDTEQVVPLVNHQAYIRYAKESDCILMENEKGVRYVPAKAVVLEPLIQQEEPCETEKTIGKSGEDEQEEACDLTISAEQILKIEQNLEEAEGIEDPQLLWLCSRIFEKGINREKILQYLCRYYKGTLSSMEQIWLAARRFDLDTYGLEERFLAQLFYTEVHTGHMEEIFCSYYTARGNELILMAGMSWFSYQYFVKNKAVHDPVFLCIDQQLSLGNALNDCCRLAYFKWLANQKEPGEKQIRQMEGLLQEYTKRQMYFCFYRKLPKPLLRKYQLYDLMVLEYRSNPTHRVHIRSCFEGESRWKEEELMPVFEGIFSRPEIMFPGEKLLYEISETAPDGKISRKKGSLSLQEKTVPKGCSAYDRICKMTEDLKKNDYAAAEREYQEYRRNQQQTENCFGLL